MKATQLTDVEAGFRLTHRQGQGSAAGERLVGKGDGAREQGGI